MIPEEGSASDFKHALLHALPPIPRYRELHWLDNPIVKWGVMLNGSMGADQLLLMLVDFVYGVSTWTTWMRLPVSIVQFGCVWLLLVSHRHGENRRAVIFEEFRTYYDRAKEAGAWWIMDSVEQRMANMIRRRSCNLITDWRVLRRNKRRVETRQCPCCKQISYGRRSQEEGAFFTETVYTFLEICPLCGWDWT
jgi:hypothetical protein